MKIVYIFLGFLFLLQCCAAFYGLPQLLDPDEMIFVEGAYQILRPPFGDPQWYGAPASTIMSFMAAAYIPYIVILMFGFGINNPGEFLLADPSGFVLIGRLLCVCIYMLSVIAFFRLSNRLMDKYPAYFATACFAFAPQLVWFSHTIRMDGAMILFLILLFHACLEIQKSGSWKSYLCAGASFGAAVVSKYPSVIGFVAVLVSSFLSFRQTGSSFKDMAVKVMACGLTSLLVAFVFGPYLFLNFSGMLQDVLFEARSSHLSATSNGFWDNLVFYSGSGLLQIVGAGTIFAALLGLIKILRTKETFFKILPILVFSLCFLVFISSLSLQWARWELPLIILLCLLAGYGYQVCADVFSTAKAGQILQKTAVVLLLLPAIIPSARILCLHALNLDTRVIAYEWIAQNIQPDDGVLIETYAPQLSREDFNVYIARDDGIVRLEDAEPVRLRPEAFYGSIASHLEGKDSDPTIPSEVKYILIADWVDRYEREADRYHEELKFYRDVAKRFDLVATFEQDLFTLGRTVRVYKQSRP